MRSTQRWRAGIGALALLIGAGLVLAEPPEGKGRPDEAGNNLSYPVIWAEGVAKELLGTPGEPPALAGVWWYWWGTAGEDPDVYPLSCLPDPDDEVFCDDQLSGSTGGVPGAGYVRAYIQKDPDNVWQAAAMMPEEAGIQGPVVVDWIDWGDNLESVDWYTRSQVRTEVVLFQENLGAEPWREYEMRHVAGWGIDEVHGLAATETGEPPEPQPVLGAGTRGTVYSQCARLTIQKLLVDRADPALLDLEWVSQAGWSNPEGQSLVNPPIFNMAVHEGGDGPGYYSAEINVKGRVIFGYTWNVRRLNDQIVNGGSADGDHRITFSFDEQCGAEDILLNTFFVEGTTQIMVPLEETTEAEPEGGGAVAVLDAGRNLTYIDVRILNRETGKDKEEKIKDK